MNEKFENELRMLGATNEDIRQCERTMQAGRARRMGHSVCRECGTDLTELKKLRGELEQLRGVLRKFISVLRTILERKRFTDLKTGEEI